MTFLQKIMDGYRLFVEKGQYLALFFVALFLLWFFLEDKQKTIRFYATAMLILILCPLSAVVLMKYQTDFFGYVDLLALLPITILVAHVMTLLIKRFVSGKHLEKYAKYKEGIAVFVLAVLLFLCGNMTLMGKENRQENGLFSKQAEAVLYYVDTTDRQVYLVAPKEIMECARIYDGRILLPYGKSLWDPVYGAYTYDDYSPYEELNGWINGTLNGLLDTEVSENYFSFCSSAGYDYLVFPKARTLEEGFGKAAKMQSDYKMIADTDYYVIYKLD